MKNRTLFFGVMLFATLLWVGCTPNSPVDNPDEPNEVYIDEGPIAIMFPEPAKEIKSLSLSEEQQGYQQNAGKFALGTMAKLYKGKSFVLSPLSLQMALSLAANGASGDTEVEILKVLGFDGIGANALNAYSKALLDQLPALDMSATLKLANIMVLNKYYRVLDSYREAIASNYYAPVVNADFADKEKTLPLINDWCNQNTNGLIPKILEDINSEDLAYLMNALYFKAPWSDSGFDPDWQVVKGESFKAGGTGSVKVDYLTGEEWMSYQDLGNYRMISKPLGKKRGFIYTVLLPKEDTGLEAMLKKLDSASWTSLLSNSNESLVHFRFPKYETESSFSLKETLVSLGMQRAFANNAEFDRMISSASSPYIQDVIQKSKLTVDEGGVEGASITVTTMGTTSGEVPPKPIEFIADHPFAYVISEQSSGTILFTGVFDGK